MNHALLILMLSFLYTDFLWLYFYNRLFEGKSSLKIQIWATLGLWCLDCLIKLFPVHVWGMEQNEIMNLIVIITSFLYAWVLFKAPLFKIFLSTAMYIVVQATMDMIGVNLTYLIAGSYNMYDTQFLLIAVVCSGTLITLGTVILVQLWKVLEEKSWRAEGYQWLCVILPLSQYVILQQTVMYFSRDTIAVPITMIAGLFLGIFADIYMFLLFDRMHAKKEAEKELVHLKYQYELEQLRYEELIAVQEETEKIKHDFQNYLIVLNNMEN